MQDNRTPGRPTTPAHVRWVWPMPSGAVPRPMRRSSAGCPAPARRAARGSARSVPVPESSRALAWLVEAFHGHSFLRSVDGGLGLGRHVVLIVLGQDLGRVKHPVGAKRTLRDDAFAFLEQIGQQPRVGYRNG